MLTVVSEFRKDPQQRNRKRFVRVENATVCANRLLTFRNRI